MSKWLILVVFTFFTANVVRAQQNNLEIQGTGSSVYLEHTVAPKENFYSLGRMFNVNPKDLAAFNHLHFATGLNIGQVLKIPLTKNNFTQAKTVLAGEALVPVHHTVAAGETLYRLGVNYNKVPLSSLKKWNQMASDAVTVGEPMIIGYLKVDKNQSALANGQPQADVANAAVTQQSSPAVAANEKKENPVVSATANVPEVQPKSTPDPTDNSTAAVTSITNSPSDTSGAFGFFKSVYDQQVAGKSTIDKNGLAGVFKSTSGWQDEKFYCFCNDAEAGTILKVTNAANGKSVYAKVLDVIPDISQNNGLIIVISNSATDKLGAGTDNFQCKVSFAQK